MSRSDFKLSEIRYPSDISDGSDASDISDSPSENEKQPLKIPEFATEAERTKWEHKQRSREYRVAAEKEKRSRKADEKKQRRLNATMLLRMTKNTDKSNQFGTSAASDSSSKKKSKKRKRETEVQGQKKAKKSKGSRDVLDTSFEGDDLSSIKVVEPKPSKPAAGKVVNADDAKKEKKRLKKLQKSSETNFNPDTDKKEDDVKKEKKHAKRVQKSHESQQSNLDTGKKQHGPTESSKKKSIESNNNIAKSSKPISTDKPEIGNNEASRSMAAPEAKRDPVASAAEQWNPDALGGDAVRRNKFLRLLGAGKASSGDTALRPRNKLNVGSMDIGKVQNELERQFEAGVRLKHDGLGKRRGLGA